jgi:hypothetical protein
MSMPLSALFTRFPTPTPVPPNLIPLGSEEWADLLSGLHDIERPEWCTLAKWLLNEE